MLDSLTDEQKEALLSWAEHFRDSMKWDLPSYIRLSIQLEKLREKYAS